MIREFLDKIIAFISNLLQPGSVISFDEKTDLIVSKDLEKRWYMFDGLFKMWGGVYGVPWWHLKAFALCESALGHPDMRVGYDGKSWGLMHFTIPTASQYLGRPATIEDIQNDDIAVKLAGKYYKHLRKVFPFELRKAVISYNQGEGNTLKGYYSDPVRKYWERWESWRIKIEQRDML